MRRFTIRKDDRTTLPILKRLREVYGVSTLDETAKRAVSIALLLSQFAHKDGCIHLIDARQPRPNYRTN